MAVVPNYIQIVVVVSVVVLAGTLAYGAVPQGQSQGSIGPSGGSGTLSWALMVPDPSVISLVGLILATIPVRRRMRSKAITA